MILLACGLRSTELILEVEKLGETWLEALLMEPVKVQWLGQMELCRLVIRLRIVVPMINAILRSHLDAPWEH
jgi:hypothetical protein